MTKTTENTIEKTALEWLGELGYERAFGPDISPAGDALKARALANSEELARRTGWTMWTGWTEWAGGCCV